MRKKEFSELKLKEKKELLKLISDKKLELVQITGKMYAGKEKNLKKSKSLRRDIAQIFTVITMKEKKTKWKYLQEL